MSSKLSPYRRNAVQHKYLGNREQPSRLTQKSRLGRSGVSTQYTPDKKAMDGSYIFKVTERKRNQSQVRIETLLEQNKYLLSENSELSSLVADRGQTILAFQQRLDQQVSREVRTLEQIQYEKNRFIQEFQLKTKDYNNKIEELVEEIGNLHGQIYKADINHQTQNDDLKVHLTVEHKRQIESLLKTHNKTTQIMQISVNQLRQALQHEQNEKHQLSYQLSTSEEKNRAEIARLNQQITHLLHMKKLQSSEQKVQFENIIQSLAREHRKEQEVTILTYEMEIKKIKHEVSIKKIEVHQLLSEVQVGKIETQTKENELEENRTHLEAEVLEHDRRNREILFREKQNLKKTNESELNTVNTAHQSKVAVLLSEIQKLKSVNTGNKQEIKGLVGQITKLRTAKNQQIKSSEDRNTVLKQKILEMQQDNQQDEEAFKTKMAVLHHADIESLRNYYENHIAVMLQDIQNRQHAIEENREKVHKEMQEKTQLRKTFQGQISKLKVWIGQLEVKLSEGAFQRRQQHANMNSKIQLTSMNLIRQTNEKGKCMIFYDQERRKLETLIITKDSEIANLEEKITQLKKDYQQQILDRQQTIHLGNTKFEDLERQLKKQQIFNENKLKKLEKQNSIDKAFYQGQIKRLKEQHSEQYASAVRQLTIEKTFLETCRSQLTIRIKQLSAELSKNKEHRQQQGLDRDITLEEEKSRLISQKGLLEVSLKNFYETQIQQKNHEIRDLHQQLREKEEDIREHHQKYHKLQKKLNQLLHSQEKLREIENKVLVVGEENSKIKSLAEVIRGRRKC